MHTSQLRELFTYNTWANERILTAAAHLSEEQFLAPAPFSHGGVRDTLVHVMSAEWVWRTRCQEGVSPPGMLSPADFPVLASVQSFWQAEAQKLRDYIDSLGDADISGVVVEYQNTKGKPFAHPLWKILLHLLNHGTQHRGEVAAMLTGYGHSPGDIDFVIFMRDMEK